MIRLYREHVQRILLALIYLRHHVMPNGDLSPIIQWCGDNLDRIRFSDNDRGFRDLLRKIISGVLAAPGRGDNEATDQAIGVSLDVSISQLLAQMMEEYRGHADKDLIDAIVNSLQLPWSANVIGGRRLDHLREAVLLPSEMTKSAARLRKVEYCCAGCDRRLNSGEMVTWRMDGDGQAKIFCHACERPAYVACDDCQEFMPLDRRYKNAHREKTTCGCKERKAKGIDQPVGVGLVDIGARPEAQERLRRRPAVAAAAPRNGGPFGRIERIPPAAAGRLDPPQVAQAARNWILEARNERNNAAPPPPPAPWVVVGDGNIPPLPDPDAPQAVAQAAQGNPMFVDFNRFRQEINGMFDVDRGGAANENEDGGN